MIKCERIRDYIHNCYVIDTAIDNNNISKYQESITKIN